MGGGFGDENGVDVGGSSERLWLGERSIDNVDVGN